MKKNLWVLLALSALIAMFVIAGCAPKPSPSPTPTPTTTPKPTPKPDTECPKVVSTEVVKTYFSPCDSCFPWVEVSDSIYTNCLDVTATPAFKIIITFDENIDPIKSSCILNPANWVIEVTNPERYFGGNLDNKKLTLADGEVEITNVEIDGKKIIVTAGVIEYGWHDIFVLPNGTKETIEYLFCGLICNSDDAKSYANVLNGKGNFAIISGAVTAPTVADEVYWKLNNGCVVADELGNFCCEFEGKDCCVEPICETCAPCPLEGSICQ